VNPAPRHVLSRIGAAVLGGYGFVWGFTTLGTTSGLELGMTYGDALTAIYLLSFLVFLAAFIWAFAARSLVRAWSVLVGGGALMTGAAWLLA
jgi:hypothetical protein